MKTVLLLGGPAAGQRVEVHGCMKSVFGQVNPTHAVLYNVVPMCSHGEVHWFGVLDGTDPLALLIAGYASPAPLVERVMGALPAFEAPYGIPRGAPIERWGDVPATYEAGNPAEDKP